MKKSIRLTSMFHAGSALTCAVFSTAASYAQDAQQDGLTEVVVTGSRVVREDYSAPTPVTAVSAEALRSAAPASLTDAINQLPQLGSSTTRANGNPVAGALGQFLNLRSLGNGRTLILLNGERVTPNTNSGLVDVNMMPELLVSNIDIVTGGASAAYGSEAVSGVVNYQINDNLEGFTGIAQSGISKYDDDRSKKFGLGFGTGFANDRGHFIASAEYSKQDGIQEYTARPSTKPVWFAFGNGSAQYPWVDTPNATNLINTFGGLIVNSTNNRGTPTAVSPLAGTEFAPDGTPIAFTPGTNPYPGLASNIAVGGSGATNNFKDLLVGVERATLFTKVKWDFSDTLTGSARVSWAQAESSSWPSTLNISTANNFTIFADNAYLPEQTRVQMAALGLSSFRFARFFRDAGRIGSELTNEAWEANVRLDGQLANDWTWNAYYTHGDARADEKTINMYKLTNLYAAADAVRDPATGQIACRVTLTNPTTAPGCVPMNMFGDGNVSQAALDYIRGPNPHIVNNKQDVVAVNIAGEAFELPAGVISWSGGLEYRHRSLKETSNPDALNQVVGAGIRGLPASICPTPTTCRFGSFYRQNYGESDASDDVKEGYLETVMPLLKDMPFAESLDLNAAIRYADYTASGGVTTWKVGLGYKPVRSLRFRAVTSRDIRAPNLYELYAAPTSGTAAFLVDAVNPANPPTTVLTTQRGREDLRPEEGQTHSFGVVYTPGWLEGFAASVDYYKIEISDAITQSSAQQIVNQCARGDQTACALITRTNTNTIASILVVPVNANSLAREGVDVDASYARPIGPGTVRLRAVASYTDSFTTTSGGVTTEYAGWVDNPIQGIPLGTPTWRGTFSIAYDWQGLGLFVQERYIGEARRLGAAGPREVFAQPKLPNVFYTDLTLSYKGEFAGSDFEIFGTVNNLTDKQPPIWASNAAAGLIIPTVTALYDIEGRYYTLGVKFKL